MTSAFPGQEKGGNYYVATADIPSLHPVLRGEHSADIAIIGGGFTGLSAALHSAEKGANVILLEASRIGSGASGRNGGQLHSGQRQDPEWFEARFGIEAARDYYQLGEAGKQLVADLCARSGVDAQITPGLIHAVHKKSYVGEYQEHVNHLNAAYNVPLEWLDAQETASRIGSEGYFGSVYDPTAAHLHPLRFAFGLEKLARNAGVQLFENSPVLALEGKNLVTEHGKVTADQIMICGNGYLSGLEGQVESRAMPIRNYIAVTRPLKDTELPIVKNECVADSRFVVNYWRQTADRRLLFGGGETYASSSPTNIAQFVRRPMARVYPQFADIEIEYAWGGTLAITYHRLPYIRELRPGVFTASGFSGQGVNMAPIAGKILAEAAQGDRQNLEFMARIPAPAFPGGKWLRWPTMVAGMYWYALRDWI